MDGSVQTAGREVERGGCWGAAGEGGVAGPRLVLPALISARDIVT